MSFAIGRINMQAQWDKDQARINPFIQIMIICSKVNVAPHLERCYLIANK